MATLRQRKAFTKMVENGGVISRAMRDADYSPNTAISPKKLTSSKGWKELMEKYLDDTKLAKRHNEQLNSSKLTKLYFDIDDDEQKIEEVVEKLGCELLYVKVNKAGDGKTAYVKAPDLFYRDLALDKAYKIKGRYSEEGSTNNNVLIIQVSEAIVQKNALNMDDERNKETKELQG